MWDTAGLKEGSVVAVVEIVVKSFLDRTDVSDREQVPWQ